MSQATIWCCRSVSLSFCSTVTIVFLCRSNGVECEVISGYSKGYSYRQGDSFRNKSTNHAWNAVCADGKWRLLDSCWGAGYCDDQHRFQVRFNEHHFAAPPEQFLVSHLPEEERWQLLAEPITLEQFEKMASPKPDFFHLGLSLSSHTSSMIRSKSGDVEIKINNPCAALLVADLRSIDDKKTILDGHAMVQTLHGAATMSVHCPSAGDFVVNLYGLPSTYKTLTSSNLTYGFLMEYTVRAQATKPDRPPRFPTLYTCFFQRHAYLFSPVSLSLAQKSKPVEFHVLVPAAQKVAVSVDEKQSQLQRHKNNEWKGKVDLPPSLSSESDVTIICQFPGTTEEDYDPFYYVSLLKYPIHWPPERTSCSLIFC